ncbi:MAG: 16S rRNA (uracil(1498)-N(3))-methyltransferase [Bacteroidetes bacterium]|nr:16S rRNA (uracil(1498)-N(3))-methyltransferase [Bacteroidota bacterium]
MNERLYYEPDLNSESKIIVLNEEESHHLLKVIRTKKGEFVSVMNGKGLIARATVRDIANKKVYLNITDTLFYPEPKNRIHLAICPLKKREKLEWIIEKATEMGVSEISFVLSENTERSTFNINRFDKIIASSAKQSINPYLPKLNPIVKFNAFIERYSDMIGQKLIAWCGTDNQNHLSKFFNATEDVLILIGPEGDFSEQEVSFAIGNNFVPANLGNFRLRSETAALYAIAAIQTLKEL